MQVLSQGDDNGVQAWEVSEGNDILDKAARRNDGASTSAGEGVSMTQRGPQLFVIPQVCVPVFAWHCT
jgi:hypothetical protein